MTVAGTARQEPLRRAPAWLLAALFASLALNLVVVGLVAGAMWRFHTRPTWAGVSPSLLGYASTLPPERRRRLWDQTVDERGQFRLLRREVRAARDEAVKALAAEPFDRQLFVAAQARHIEAEGRARRAIHELDLKIAEGLTPEERRAFAHWRAHRRPAGHNLLDGPDHQSQGAKSDAADH